PPRRGDRRGRGPRAGRARAPRRGAPLRAAHRPAALAARDREGPGAVRGARPPDRAGGPAQAAGLQGDRGRGRAVVGGRRKRHDRGRALTGPASSHAGFRSPRPGPRIAAMLRRRLVVVVAIALLSVGLAQAPASAWPPDVAAAKAYIATREGTVSFTVIGPKGVAYGYGGDSLVRLASA